MYLDRPIPGGWKVETLAVAERAFELLLPANPDAVFYHLEDHPEASATLGGDPYWSQLWPTSLRLAECILKTDWPAGRSAIELGCGIGLAGLAALVKGLRVTLSDYNPLAVELAVENAGRNGFSAEGLVLDWRSPPKRKFDVILASDVIYDRNLHEPLLHTLETVSHCGSVIWIGDGGRSATEDFVLMALERFDVELLDEAGQPATGVPLGQYRRMVVGRRV